MAASLFRAFEEGRLRERAPQLADRPGGAELNDHDSTSILDVCSSTVKLLFHCTSQSLRSAVLLTLHSSGAHGSRHWLGTLTLVAATEVVQGICMQDI